MPMPVFADGTVASCGALLVVAGAAKAYAGARRIDGDDAIRRALRVPRPAWRLVLLATAVAEAVAGALVCAGAYALAGGIAMAALGAAFCAALGYARYRRASGGCGCLGGRKPVPGAAGQGAITWREIARAGLLAGAGIALAAAPPPGASGLARLSAPWFCAGFVAGAVLIVALSSFQRPRLREPRCHRPIWRPVRAAARGLASSGVFLAMSQSAGPFDPVAAHQRSGCADDYWFTPAAGNRRAVVFSVRHRPRGESPAIHAVLTDSPLPPGATLLRPPRAFPASVLTNDLAMTS
jgi:hypothetical protein